MDKQLVVHAMVFGPFRFAGAIRRVLSSVKDVDYWHLAAGWPYDLVGQLHGEVLKYDILDPADVGQQRVRAVSMLANCMQKPDATIPRLIRVYYMDGQMANHEVDAVTRLGRVWSRPLAEIHIPRPADGE